MDREQSSSAAITVTVEDLNAAVGSQQVSSNHYYHFSSFIKFSLRFDIQVILI